MKWSVTLLGGTLLLLGATLNATTTFSELEADVFLSCGGNAMCDAVELSIGDFDGDGFEDVQSLGIGIQDFIVFGDNSLSGGSVPSLRTTRIELHGTSSMGLDIGDITGDGKADFFSVNTRDAIISVVLGRPNPPALISQPADFTIAGGHISNNNSISFGDVNGDSVKDLLFNIVEGTAYVVFGSTSFQNFSSTISLSDTAHVMKILGGGRGKIASGDVDGDGFDDILMGDQKNATPRTQPGVVYVIRGSTSLPSVWDLSTRSPDWTIYGEGLKSLDINFAADFTGDGKADLGLDSVGPKLLNGASLLAIGPIIKLTPGYSNSLTPMDMQGSGAGDEPGMFVGSPRDFDGDGRPDLLCAASTGKVYLYLSHSFPAGSVLPEVSPLADIQFTDLDRSNYLYGRTVTLTGDLNGDGKSDLIYKSETFPRWNVFYGYRPLENPSIVVQSRESNQARVHLSLSVEGEPAEMKLTGGILDPAPGVWIPFQENVDVTLTPTAEEKTVTVVFRTSGKRESDSVSATIPLVVGEPGASVVTNLLREGGTARVESRLDTAGRLKAVVYSREGKLLRDLVDEDMSSGVHVIKWDGKNAAGETVSPGVYVLVVTVNGHSEIHKIVVQG